MATDGLLRQGDVLEVALNGPTGGGGCGGPILATEEKVKVMMSGSGAPGRRSVVGQVTKSAIRVTVELENDERVEAHIVSLADCPVSAFVAWTPDTLRAKSVTAHAAGTTYTELRSLRLDDRLFALAQRTWQRR